MRFVLPCSFLILAGLLPLPLFLVGCDSSIKRPTGQKEPASPAAAKPPTAPKIPADEIAESNEIENTQPKPKQTDLKILHWNIESGGNHPPLIADQLAGFVSEGGYSIIALSEVEKVDLYQRKFDSLGETGQWQSVLGDSARKKRDADRLMIFYDSSRLKLLRSQELNKHGEFNLNTGRHRSPLLAHFEDRSSKEDFILIQNHLARGNAEFRAEQAKGLREFGRDSSIAKIGVGDYNFDFVFETRQGNQGFVEMLRDNVWKWVEPEELIDTNWYDPEPDGIDNYPGSMLDFTFVAGEAKDWDVTSKVIVRKGDFPDNEKTSDHRPVEVLIRF